MENKSKDDIQTIDTTNPESNHPNEAKLNNDQEKVGDERIHEIVEGDHVVAEYVKRNSVEEEHVEGGHVKRERVEDEHVEGECIEGEHLEEEHAEDEELEGEHNEKGTDGDKLEGENAEEEELKEEEKKDEQKIEEVQEEEDTYVEEPPPDPTAPFNFSDSTEALKEPFQLRPEQLSEVEQLWEYYQNYTPAYTDLDNYITDKELVYMLKALLLMTVTEEQFYELIDYCVRPPHPKGHINFDQFVKMVTIRQRDTSIEDELRNALQVFDPERTGSVDRENLKEVLAKQGYKMSQKHLDNLIKEVDLSNDGTLGIEDIIGTMCIDLNKEDLQLLLASINPPREQPPPAGED